VVLYSVSLGFKHITRERIGNAKVSARQQWVYEGPLAKKSTANQRKKHNFHSFSLLVLPVGEIKMNIYNVEKVHSVA